MGSACDRGHPQGNSRLPSLDRVKRFYNLWLAMTAGSRLQNNPTRRAILGAGAGMALGCHAASAAPRRIQTVIGTGVPGHVADGAPAGTATLNQPYGVYVDREGALYWADFGSDRILMLRRGSGLVSVAAGTGTKGHSGDGGPAKLAQLSAPHEVRFDRRGNMLVAERDANVIRRIDRRTGLVSTLVGTGTPGFDGDGGPSEEAQLKQPHSIALDRRDSLYICDIQNNRVRRRDAATGLLTTFAGNGEVADTPDEAPLATSLHGPRSIDIAPDGAMYLILREGNKVFRIDPATKSLRRIAGTGAKGYAGDKGPARDALWNGPKGIAYSPDGNLYIADTENHVIRRVSLQDGRVDTVAGTGVRGDGPDGAPLGCALARPHGVFVHGGLLYIGDAENHRIRALEI
jgi:DNA-binding beta-propeller fold protein YncE